MLIFVAVIVPVAAQNPAVRIANTTRPGADFQVGDRFEIAVTGAASQPVSVRTTMQGRSDWSPVIGWTDSGGRWSTTGQFEKADFGPWSEAWTLGGKLANPVVGFSVAAPCVPAGRGMSGGSGPNVFVSCETAAGMQTFVTPSFGDAFRTPDGRVITGRRQPGMDMPSLIEESGGHSGQHGDDAAALIMKVIGANALNDRETRNVLSIIRAAFQNRNVVPPTSNPETLVLLRRLERETEDESLKKEISETIAFVLTQ